MLQTYYNLELKQGRYDQLKQGCIKCITTQWCQLWAKIKATSSKFLGVNHICFWSLGNQESNTSNGLQFRVEWERYDQLKHSCTKSMLLCDYIRVQFLLFVWAEFWATSWAQFFMASGPFGLSIFTNPVFGCKAIFGNLHFIQILITKYATRSLKAMGKIYI